MNRLAQIKELGLDWPAVARPVGSYVPAVQVGDDVYTSGQIPTREGRLIYTGKVGRDLTLEDGRAAAELCVLNGLAAIASVIRDLDRVEQIVRLCVYVNSAPGFTDQPKVANGASDLLGRIFDDLGKHVRSAVGVAELPLNAAVELELLVRVR